MLSEKQIKDAENFGREDGFRREGCAVYYKRPAAAGAGGVLNEPGEGLFATFQTVEGAISFLAYVEGLRFYLRRARELHIAVSLYQRMRDGLTQKRRDELVDKILEGVRLLHALHEEAVAEVSEQNAVKAATDAVERAMAAARKHPGN